MTSTLRKALAPFTHLSIPDYVPDNTPLVLAAVNGGLIDVSQTVTAGDVRAAKGALSAPEQDDGWLPIVSAPISKTVDLWCIYGDESVAQYEEGGRVIGELVSGRHKTDEFGWFGNQSRDGVPRANGYDLVPVAWRWPVPNCPVNLVEAFLAARPLPSPPVTP